MKTKILKAFTLIELLIVIVIIGVLATALIPRITGMQNKARYARVEKDFRDFRIAVLMAQNNTNKTLQGITGRGCTHCSCRSGGSYSGLVLYTYPINHACRLDWADSLRKIEAAAGMPTGSLASLESDPWGSPYMFDENEVQPTCASHDSIRTFGPDGLYQGHNPQASNDDKRVNIAPQGCPGSY